MSNKQTNAIAQGLATKAKRKLSQQQFLMIVTVSLLVVMYVIGMILFFDRGFNHFQTFLNLFIDNAGLIVIASGLTVVMITGGIDISVGSFVALSCMMMAYMMENMGVGAVPSMLVVLITGLVFGLVQGWLISYLKIQSFIVTLAGMFFARGMTAIISQEMIAIQNDTFLKIAQFQINLPFGGYYSRRGNYVPAYIYPTVVTALLIVVIIFVVLRYTKFGRRVYAIGGNEQSAMLMGLDARKTRLQAYVLDGFLCAIGGILFCLNTCSGFVDQARGLEMEAIASAVIGGTLLTGGVGNVFGSLLGVMIRGTIDTIIKKPGTLSSWWTTISIAVLLAFFIILQSLLSSASRKSKK